MQNCPRCNVEVLGDKEVCPLCQGELTGVPSSDPYKRLPKFKYSKHFIFKIISFSAITLIILSLALNMMIEKDTFWSLFAIGGAVSLWATASVGFSYRKKLFKNLTLQLFIVTLAAIAWDVFVGWQGWSVDFVMPCVCTAYMVAVLVLSKIIQGPRNSYIIYLFINCIYSLIPLILLFLGVVKVMYPTVISSALSLILLCALAFFEGKAFKEEMEKKLHV